MRSNRRRRARRNGSGDDEYRTVRAEAQRRANQSGVDYGVEKLGGHYRYFMLPQKKNRTGHELRCEVVMPELIEKTMPGHGVRSNRGRVRSNRFGETKRGRWVLHTTEEANYLLTTKGHGKGPVPILVQDVTNGFSRKIGEVTAPWPSYLSDADRVVQKALHA
jgi:hypothetical protein